MTLTVLKKCCVNRCSHTSENSHHNFFSFPATRSRYRRQRWLKAIREINGDNWCPNANTFVCSSHFVNGELSFYRNYVNFVPTIFNSIKTIYVTDDKEILSCPFMTIKQFALEYIKYDALLEKPTQNNFNNEQRKCAYEQLAKALCINVVTAHAWESRFRIYFESRMSLLAKRKVKPVRGQGVPDWLCDVEERLQVTSYLEDRLTKQRSVTPGDVVSALCGAARAHGALCGSPLYHDARRALRLNSISINRLHAIWVQAQRVSLEQVMCAGRAGERPPAAAPHAAAAVADLVLLHTDVEAHALLTAESVELFEESEALHTLWQLVQRHRLEEAVPTDSQVRAQRWTRAYRDYLKSGRVTSLVVLQRRWHELKLQARQRLAAHWRRAGPAREGRGEGQGEGRGEGHGPPRDLPRPAPIHLAILKRYPHIVTSVPTSWRQLVLDGLIVTEPLESDMEEQTSQCTEQDVIIDLSGDEPIASEQDGTTAVPACEQDSDTDLTPPYALKSEPTDSDSETSDHLVIDEQALTTDLLLKRELITDTEHAADTETPMLEENVHIETSVTDTPILMENKHVDTTQVLENIEYLENMTHMEYTGFMEDTLQYNSHFEGAADVAALPPAPLPPPLSLQSLHLIDPATVSSEIIFESDDDDDHKPYDQYNKDKIPLLAHDQIRKRLVFADDLPGEFMNNNVKVKTEGSGDDETDVAWHGDHEIMSDDDSHKIPTIDSKLLMDCRVELVKVDEMPAWREHARHDAIEASRISGQPAVPHIKVKVEVEVDNNFFKSNCNNDELEQQTKDIKIEFPAEDMTYEVPVKTMRVRSESEVDIPLIIAKEKKDLDKMTKESMEKEKTSNLKRKCESDVDITKSKAGQREETVVSDASDASDVSEESEEWWRRCRGGHSAASTLEWRAHFGRLYGHKRVRLPDRARSRPALLTAQVAPITHRQISIHDTSLTVVAPSAVAPTGEASRELFADTPLCDNSMPNADQLDTVLAEMALSCAAQQASGAAACCAARRHRVVNDTRRRIGFPEIPLHNHGAGACSCCCAHLCDQGARARLAAQLHALHSDIAHLLQAHSEALSGKRPNKKSIYKQKSRNGAPEQPDCQASPPSTPGAPPPAKPFCPPRLPTTKPIPPLIKITATATSTKSTAPTTSAKSVVKKRRLKCGEASTAAEPKDLSKVDGYAEWVRQRNLCEQYFHIAPPLPKLDKGKRSQVTKSKQNAPKPISQRAKQSPQSLLSISVQACELSSTTLPVTCANQGTALPTLCVNQGTVLPLSPATQSTALLTSCATQGPVLPTPPATQSTVLPTSLATQSTVLPTLCANQDTELPTSCANQGTALPTSCANQGTILPTSLATHSTVLSTSPATQSTALPISCANQGTALPTSCANQATTLPTSCANQGTVLPTLCANQDTELPTLCANQDTELPTSCANQDTELPTSCANQGTALPTSCANQGTILPTSLATHSTVLSTSPATQSIALPTSCANQGTALPTSCANQGTTLPTSLATHNTVLCTSPATQSTALPTSTATQSTTPLTPGTEVCTSAPKPHTQITLLNDKLPPPPPLLPSLIQILPSPLPPPPPKRSNVPAPADLKDLSKADGYDEWVRQKKLCQQYFNIAPPLPNTNTLSACRRDKSRDTPSPLQPPVISTIRKGKRSQVTKSKKSQRTKRSPQSSIQNKSKGLPQHKAPPKLNVVPPHTDTSVSEIDASTLTQPLLKSTAQASEPSSATSPATRESQSTVLPTSSATKSTASPTLPASQPHVQNTLLDDKLPPPPPPPPAPDGPIDKTLFSEPLYRLIPTTAVLPTTQGSSSIPPWFLSKTESMDAPTGETSRNTNIVTPGKHKGMPEFVRIAPKLAKSYEIRLKASGASETDKPKGYAMPIGRTDLAHNLNINNITPVAEQVSGHHDAAGNAAVEAASDSTQPVLLGQVLGVQNSQGSSKEVVKSDHPGNKNAAIVQNILVTSAAQLGQARSVSMRIPGAVGSRSIFLVTVSLPAPPPSAPLPDTVDLTSDDESTAQPIRVVSGPSKYAPKLSINPQNVSPPIHDVIEVDKDSSEDATDSEVDADSDAEPCSANDYMLKTDELIKSIEEAATSGVEEVHVHKPGAAVTSAARLACGGALLCVDGAAPPLQVPGPGGACLVLTRRRLPLSRPTYWTLAPHNKVTRVVAPRRRQRSTSSLTDCACNGSNHKLKVVTALPSVEAVCALTSRRVPLYVLDARRARCRPLRVERRDLAPPHTHTGTSTTP